METTAGGIWSASKTVQLIEEVQRYEPIWSSNTHKDRELLSLIWNVIGVVIDKDEKQCISKWNSLRTCCNAELKKIGHTQKESDAIRRAMAFLEPNNERKAQPTLSRPTTMPIKCADICWSADLCLMQYRCVFCSTSFGTHAECLRHLVEPCERSPHQKPPQTDRRIDSAFYNLLETNGCLLTDEDGGDVVAATFSEAHEDDDNMEFVSYLDDKDTNETALAALDIESSMESNDYQAPAFEIVSTRTVTATRTPPNRRSTFDAKSFTDTEYLDNSDAVFFECDICRQRCTSRQKIFLHMQCAHIHPPQSHRPPRRSPKQLRTSTRQRIIKQPQDYCCDICGKRMAQYGNMIIHRRTHTGERPYACNYPECGRRFTNSTCRNIHQLRHSGVKPFACELCDRRFYSRYAVTGHVRLAHTDERPYECDTCRRTFKCKQTHAKHLLIHTGERPHKCETCGRRFRQRSAYLMHLNVHTDNRPFLCKVCGKGFHSSAARRSHEKIAHRMV